MNKELQDAFSQLHVDCAVLREHVAQLEHDTKAAEAMAANLSAKCTQLTLQVMREHPESAELLRPMLEELRATILWTMRTAQ